MAGDRGLIRLTPEDVLKLALSSVDQAEGELRRIGELLRMILGTGSPDTVGSIHNARSGQRPRTKGNYESNSTSSGLSVGLGPILRAPAQGPPPLNLEDIDDDKQYDVDQAAQVLRISVQTVRVKARKGLLQASKIGKGGRGGGHYRFTGAELKRFSFMNKRNSDNQELNS